MSTSITGPHPGRAPAPIRSRADALRLISIAVTRPLQPEVICVPLDSAGQGASIYIVSDADDPDSVVRVVELLARAREGDPANRLLVVSVRPHHGLLVGDVDRWLDASNIAAEYGATVVEWFVVSPAGITTPRDLLGEPERWGQ